MFSRFAFPLRKVSLVAMMALAPTAFAQDSNGPAVNTETFQSWEVNCPVNKSEGSCSMTQLVNGSDGEPVMRVVVGNPPQIDTPVMTFLLPLGVSLAPGLQMKVGTGQPMGMPYQVCVPQGCRADLPLRSEVLNQLKAGSSATVSMIDPRGQRVDMNVSLMGFSAAKDRVDRN
uniref:invasion associated locus B family protein n=1 Tax=Halomonas sp. TaxID=1486246 RepID=UPI002632FD70|nr:invasion associated locus B family protein [Halomonas sp.]